MSVAAAAGFQTIGIRLTATPSVGVPPYDALHEGPLLRETLHFSRSGGLPAHVHDVDQALLRYAQICDASADMPAPTDTPALIREARTGRLLPGEGVLPLKDLVAALPANAPLAIEAPCRDTAHLPAIERAKRAYRAMSALQQ